METGSNRTATTTKHSRENRDFLNLSEIPAFSGLHCARLSLQKECREPRSLILAAGLQPEILVSWKIETTWKRLRRELAKCIIALGEVGPCQVAYVYVTGPAQALVWTVQGVTSAPR